MMIYNKKTLYHALVESGGYPEGDFQNLCEADNEAITTFMFQQLLKQIGEIDKKVSFDVIHRSRGDITKLREIQDSISKLEEYFRKGKLSGLDKSSLDTLGKYTQTLSSSFMNIKNNSTIFKKAYVEKKTIGMKTYSTLAAYILTCTAVLMSITDSCIQDPSYFNEIDTREYDAMFEVLNKFMSISKLGVFKMLNTDLQRLRESVEEVNPDILVESSGISALIGAGFDAIVNGKMKLKGNDLSSVVYKSAGLVAVLYSIKEMIYTLFNLNVNFKGVLDKLKGFDLGGSNKLQTTSYFNTLADKAGYSHSMAVRKLETDNRGLAKSANDVKNNIIKLPEPTPVNTGSSNPSPAPVEEIDDDFVM